MRSTLLLALALSLPALAGEDDAAPGGLIARRDADGDGRLTLAEFGGDAEVFRLLDRDADGFLTPAELPRPRRPRRAERPAPGPDAPRGPARLFERHDADGDGKLSAAEWPDQAPLSFADADKNGDGFVEPDELGGSARRRPGRDDAAPPDPERVRRLAESVLRRHDRDGDGRLSGEELQGRGDLDLTKADRNGDGAVDLLEITAAVEERAGRPRGRDGGGRGPMLRRLQEMDADGDGTIDRTEWKGPEPLFDRLDQDGDGTISTEEAEQGVRRAGRGRWNDRVADAAFRRFDADGDGTITADEWKARPEMFQRFDTDGDGVITREELTPRGPRGRPGRQLDLRAGKDSAHFLQRWDADGDGRVTAREFPHEVRFKEIDTDGDGVLSTSEVEEAMDKMHREKAYGFMERFDLDGDGKVTREEFTGPAAAFERRDQNRDGVIDAADGVE